MWSRPLLPLLLWQLLHEISYNSCCLHVLGVAALRVNWQFGSFMIFCPEYCFYYRHFHYNFCNFMFPTNIFWWLRIHWFHFLVKLLFSGLVVTHHIRIKYAPVQNVLLLLILLLLFLCRCARIFPNCVLRLILLWATKLKLLQLCIVVHVAITACCCCHVLPRHIQLPHYCSIYQHVCLSVLKHS